MTVFHEHPPVPGSEPQACRTSQETSGVTADVSRPTPVALHHNSLLRHGSSVGPLIRARRQLAYHTPEEHYETVLSTLVHSETEWLDVGCGHSLLPMNVPLAEQLSTRCRRLVGIDPDPSVLANEFVHESVQTTIETYQADRPFDLITLRMVVEHITQPMACVAALHRLTKPGGKVVIYTPHRFSLSSIVADIVPNAWHHAFKRVLWATKEQDTFPTYF